MAPQQLDETDHDDADVNCGVDTGHDTVDSDYEPLENVPGSDDEDYNGPPSRKTVSHDCCW